MIETHIYSRWLFTSVFIMCILFIPMVLHTNEYKVSRTSEMRHHYMKQNVSSKHFIPAAEVVKMYQSKFERRPKLIDSTTLFGYPQYLNYYGPYSESVVKYVNRVFGVETNKTLLKKCKYDGRIVSVVSGGGSCNRLWEYMSLYAIWILNKDKYKIKPYVVDYMKTELEYAFDRLTIPSFLKDAVNCMDFNNTQFVGLKGVPNFKFPAPPRAPVLLAMYSSRYKDIIRAGTNIWRSQLRFKKTYVEYANAVLNAVRDDAEDPNGDVTFVGVHYRGGDYVNHLRNVFKTAYAGPSNYTYYRKAMKWMNAKYTNVVFIFISADVNWLSNNTSNFNDFNVVFNPRINVKLLSKFADLAVLSHCNHSIINYGTYGSSAAMFVGGTTIVYDLKVEVNERGSTLAMGLAKNLPNWHMFGNT